MVSCRALCGRQHPDDRVLCKPCWSLLPDWIRFGIHDLWERWRSAHRAGRNVEAFRTARYFARLAEIAAEEAHYRAMYPEDKCPPST